MTGPEHYREAERLLAESEMLIEACPEADRWLAEAQVHATLALAAATAGHMAVVAYNNGTVGGSVDAWVKATTERPEGADHRKAGAA